ncbi:hypothetical protein BR93DRAFT_931857 [Coniochaeta sp. PMI_546]|nr:hypothetical protein BR93DRAFT_931857 [Coniochaeta sp. PMI_546]
MACQSPLSTSTPVVVIDNIFDQKTLSTRTFTLPPTLSYSWQIAYPIQIRWKSGDFAQASVTSTSSTSTSTTSSPASSIGGGPTGSRLSTRAIAGIVIGVVIFVLLLGSLIAAIILLMRRRRQPQTTASYSGSTYLPPNNQAQDMSMAAHEDGSLWTPEVNGQGVPQELGHETHAGLAVMELDGRALRSELEGRS